MINRRDLNGYCATLGLALPVVGTIGAMLSNTSALAQGPAPGTPARTVKLPDGTVVPALGQGSARLGQGRRPEPDEQEALRTGLSVGMTLIDTAELYGNGSAERLIGG